MNDIEFQKKLHDLLSQEGVLELETITKLAHEESDIPVEIKVILKINIPMRKTIRIESNIS